MRSPLGISLFRTSVCLFIAALFIAWTDEAAIAQVCGGCQVADQIVTKSDGYLYLTNDQKWLAETTHLFGGRPKPINGATREGMIHQVEWLTWYDGDLRVPLWVAYRLTRLDATRHIERKDCFRSDPRLFAYFASTCEDYDEPIFDRGHMAPNADFDRSRYAATNSFIFSNMTPQAKRFNQVVWKGLEARVRRWAVMADGIFVITGAVFDRNNDGKRDRDTDARVVSSTGRVAIPTHFYKIVLRPRPNGIVDTITILLPNIDRTFQPLDHYFSNHITTINHIEWLTGIDFFPNIPQKQQRVLEAYRARGLWATD